MVLQMGEETFTQVTQQTAEFKETCLTPSLSSFHPITTDALLSILLTVAPDNLSWEKGSHFSRGSQERDLFAGTQVC